jgi:hypothetical protein
MTNILWLSIIVPHPVITISPGLHEYSGPTNLANCPKTAVAPMMDWKDGRHGGLNKRP